ncbi:hypothetical protein ECEC1868_3646, partial [Escherichia coli EC1868]
KNGGALL